MRKQLFVQTQEHQFSDGTTFGKYVVWLVGPSGPLDPIEITQGNAVEIDLPPGAYSGHVETLDSAGRGLGTASGSFEIVAPATTVKIAMAFGVQDIA